MNSPKGVKTSTAIKLSEGEQAMLVQAQEDGIMRGIDLLGRLTYSKWGMLKSGVGAAANIGSAAYSYGSAQTDSLGSETGQGKGDEYAKTERLVGKAWQTVASEIATNTALTKVASLLQVAVGSVLSWIKSLVLSVDVIGKAAPFFGNVKGLYDATKLARQSHVSFKNGAMLTEMSSAVASGVPSIALKSFITYAKSEGVRLAAKSAYTYAKSLGGIIAEIFTLGAWSLVELITSIVEAVAGFAYSLMNGILFEKVCARCRDYMIANDTPPADEFRTMISGSPFAGAVFFAGAFRIGQFNISSVLSNENRVISTNTLTNALTQINEAQKVACSYVAASHFEMTLRYASDKQEHGWILKAMKGYADETPKTDLLTENATKWQRFKYGARKAKRGMKKLKFW